MKVTFIETIESHRAWRECMGCSVCNELKYDIHHQTDPDVHDCWWIQCPNCGHESHHAESREKAIWWWKYD